MVGNEEGAHKIIADLFQALNDTGFTVPAQGATYWNGEAMRGGDYNDLDETPKAVASTNATLVRNAVHLAKLLKQQYPGTQDLRECCRTPLPGSSSRPICAGRTRRGARRTVRR